MTLNGKPITIDELKEVWIKLKKIKKVPFYRKRIELNGHNGNDWCDDEDLRDVLRHEVEDDDGNDVDCDEGSPVMSFYNFGLFECDMCDYVHDIECDDDDDYFVNPEILKLAIESDWFEKHKQRMLNGSIS